MPKTYHFSEYQIEELEKARKKNKDKTVERRLKALLLILIPIENKPSSQRKKP